VPDCFQNVIALHWITPPKMEQLHAFALRE
jgi:hypothetical protein